MTGRRSVPVLGLTARGHTSRSRKVTVPRSWMGGYGAGHEGGPGVGAMRGPRRVPEGGEQPVSTAGPKGHGSGPGSIRPRGRPGERCGGTGCGASGGRALSRPHPAAPGRRGGSPPASSHGIAARRSLARSGRRSAAVGGSRPPRGPCGPCRHGQGGRHSRPGAGSLPASDRPPARSSVGSSHSTVAPTFCAWPTFRVPFSHSASVHT